MTILTPEQLTGRVSTHVREVRQLSCSLHADAARALIALVQKAASDEIDLVVASSFRSFERQLAIWNAKFRGQRPLLDRNGRALDCASMDEEEIVRAILQWSALPGASRHHWGTEVDVFDRAALTPATPPQLTPPEYGPNGAFARLSAWLAEHAADYGFFWPYDSDRGGVQPEPWHLSFAPVASAALPAVTLEVLADALSDAELAGAAVVRRRLSQIHECYVGRVATASSKAQAGAAVPAVTLGCA